MSEQLLRNIKELSKLPTTYVYYSELCRMAGVGIQLPYRSFQTMWRVAQIVEHDQQIVLVAIEVLHE